MRRHLICFILICVNEFSFCCNPLWYNLCKTNTDCCSGNCDRPGDWAFGVCKPSNGGNGENGGNDGCKPLWYNLCDLNSDCCSNFCHREQASWKYGVCKNVAPAPTPAPAPAPAPAPTPKCHSDYYNLCTSNGQCCSNICERDPSWKYGVCQPTKGTGERTDIQTEQPSTTVETCQKNGFRECISNKQCCSNYCHKVEHWYYGECKKPRSGNGKPSSMCGVAISNFARPAVGHGKHTELGEFPWHTGIYEKKDGNWEQICGGTLISHRVVISAAHCFEWEDKEERKIYVKKLSLFRIGLGKYYRPLYAHEDDMAQIVDVKNIQFSPQYHGSYGLWANDIAFVTLQTQVEYTNAVRPVCIDFSDDLEDEQLAEGTMGKIVGWGLTEEQKASETLLIAEMPFVSRDECRSKISQSLLSYLRNDKLCAGDQNSKVTVCPGDSGGGLVFENKKTKSYYLRGVVSLGPRGCKGREFALFTKLSAHKDLVERYLRL